MRLALLTHDRAPPFGARLLWKLQPWTVTAAAVAAWMAPASIVATLLSNQQPVKSGCAKKANTAAPVGARFQLKADRSTWTGLPPMRCNAPLSPDTEPLNCERLMSS